MESLKIWVGSQLCHKLPVSLWAAPIRHLPTPAEINNWFHWALNQNLKHSGRCSDCLCWHPSSLWCFKFKSSLVCLLIFYFLLRNQMLSSFYRVSELLKTRAFNRHLFRSLYKAMFVKSSTSNLTELKIRLHQGSLSLSLDHILAFVTECLFWWNSLACAIQDIGLNDPMVLADLKIQEIILQAPGAMQGLLQVPTNDSGLQKGWLQGFPHIIRLKLSLFAVHILTIQCIH